MARPRCDRNLPLRIKAVLLEEPEELQFQGGADTGGEGFQPGARIVEVAGFQWCRGGRLVGKLFEVGQNALPTQYVVEPLILVGLQTPVAGGFAARMIQVLKGVLRDQMEFIADSREIATAANGGVNEGKRRRLAGSTGISHGPRTFQSELDLRPIQEINLKRAVGLGSSGRRGAPDCAALSHAIG